MSNNLLIVGAGQYGRLVKEIAVELGIYDKIDFVDDNSDKAVCRISEIDSCYPEYGSAVVAIGDPVVRRSMIEMLLNTKFEIAAVVSPRAYVSPTAKIGNGCVVEPFAAIQSEAVIGDGCFVSAGAVVNHNCVVGGYSHVDCNASVMKSSVVPEMSYIKSNTTWIVEK
ncbi:MAG: hypothetical protein J6K77_02060 [Ruminococcus sp.]|nr:hypothetical protein [Ruminococcus sp.]